jgi:hypothetical protein
MISVIESKLIHPDEDVPENHQCLYIRRDVNADRSYREYSYVGPREEVQALAERCREVDMEKLDVVLRTGKSFDEALKELGK